MSARLDALEATLRDKLGSRLEGLIRDRGELTIAVKPSDLTEVAHTLRDAAELRFEQLIDVCGMDYLRYKDSLRDGPRFAAIYHLLSITHNRRLRMRIFAADDDVPVIDSVVDIWPSANWYEREAFDLFGIVFAGHPDLRRILTDYGFVGHPFRKDFPLSGNVEMRYDPDQQRVIYQPVTIEPREIVPRVIREQNYADTEKKS